MNSKEIKIRGKKYNGIFGKQDIKEEEQAKKEKQFHEEVEQYLLPNEKIVQVIEMIEVDKVNSIKIVPIPGTTTRTEVQIEYEGKSCTTLCTKKDSNTINFVEMIDKEIVKR